MNCSPASAIKNEIYLVTLVARKPRCSLGWGVVWVRSQVALQHGVEQAPKAKWYYSEGLDAYQGLWYHFGRYETSEGKSDTDALEADQAEVRH